MKSKNILAAAAVAALCCYGACRLTMTTTAHPAVVTECVVYADGRVDSLSVPATYVTSPMRVNVALPGNYFTSATDRFPVVYLLNGHGGHQNSWGGLVPLDSIASEYNMVIVTLDGRNSWYFDSPEIPEMQMESFITKELVPYIDANYRTLADRDHRAITGYSMGGHGALWLAIRHKDLFGNVGSTSGGVDFTGFPNRWNLDKVLGDCNAQARRWHDNTVMSQLDKLQKGDLNIIFDCGTEDFFYDVNNRLDSALNAAHISHTYITTPGIHNGEYWKKSIYPQLDFFKKQFQK